MLRNLFQMGDLLDQSQASDILSPWRYIWYIVIRSFLTSYSAYKYDVTYE